MEDRGRRLLIGPLLSVLLGLLSVLLLLRLVTGVPALIVGFSSLRQLNVLGRDMPGTRWPKRLAVAGMVLGVAGCLLGVLGLTSFGLLQFGAASRRLTCADHMRQIGSAVERYHEVHGEYPPATMDGPDSLAGFAPWLDEPYPKRLGWMVSVLPFLEVPDKKQAQGPFGKLYVKFEPRLPWDAPANRDGINTPVRGFLCPSHPSFAPERRPACSHYVGVTGIGVEAVELPLGSPQAGFFGYTRRLRTLEETGYVALLTETMTDNGPWVAGDRSTLRGFEPSLKPYLGYERPFGGMHPGGANLLTVDGAVRFYTDQTAPAVLEGLASLDVEH